MALLGRFSANVLTSTASCLTAGLFEHAGEVKTCWVSFSTKMAKHATLHIPSKCDLWFYRHKKYVSKTPVCHLSVAKKRFVLRVFFSVLMAYESTFTGAINL